MAAQRYYRQRRQRSQYFDAASFGEPDWDPMFDRSIA
jgi:hypothetical protein